MEFAEREASPIAFVTAPGNTAALDRFLGAVGIGETEPGAEDQAERQQPEEDPIGKAAGENGRRNPAVPFHGPQGDSDRHVAFARSLRTRHRRTEPAAIGAAGVIGVVAAVGRVG